MLVILIVLSQYTIVDYFEEHFIGRPDRRGNRRSQIFPLTLWNVNQRVVESLPRTNNSVEGWHCGFQCSLQCTHPTGQCRYYNGPIFQRSVISTVRYSQLAALLYACSQFFSRAPTLNLLLKLLVSEWQSNSLQTNHRGRFCIYLTGSMPTCLF